MMALIILFRIAFIMKALSYTPIPRKSKCMIPLETGLHFIAGIIPESVMLLLQSTCRNNACKFVCNLLDSADFEEQVYKSCMAVINFSRTYGSDRVDRACAKAIALKSVNYTTLKNTLKMVRISSLLTKSPLMRTLQLPTMKSLDK